MRCANCHHGPDDHLDRAFGYPPLRPGSAHRRVVQRQIEPQGEAVRLPRVGVVIDKTAAERGVRHVTIDCGGGNRDGSRCRRFQWFPADFLPKTWYCHDHRRDGAS